MPWPMGQGAGLVNDIKPAGEVMERMTSEAQAVLGRLGAALKVSRFGSAVTDPLA